MFEGPVSNNKGNINVAPTPWDAPGFFYFFLFFNKYGIIHFMFENIISQNKESIKYFEKNSLINLTNLEISIFKFEGPVLSVIIN